MVIYKVESFHLFEEMLNRLNVKAMSILMRGQIYIPQPRPEEQQSAPEQPEVKRAMPERPTDYSKYKTNKDEMTASADAQRAAASGPQGPQQNRPAPVKSAPKINRNAPCPCGSGKKYKNCHGANL